MNFQGIKQEAEQLEINAHAYFFMKNNISEIYSRNNGLDGWIDGWMDEWMDGWMDGWMDIVFKLTKKI